MLVGLIWILPALYSPFNYTDRKDIYFIIIRMHLHATVKAFKGTHHLKNQNISKDKTQLFQNTGIRRVSPRDLKNFTKTSSEMCNMGGGGERDLF